MSLRKTLRIGYKSDYPLNQSLQEASKVSSNVGMRHDYIVNCFFRITGRKIEVRTALPGLKVEFSRDDGETWNDVTSGGIEVNGILKLRTR